MLCNPELILLGDSTEDFQYRISRKIFDDEFSRRMEIKGLPHEKPLGREDFSELFCSTTQKIEL
jgi:hypothetical protein